MSKGGSGGGAGGASGSSTDYGYSEKMSPDYIEPVNRITDKAKYESLVKSMEKDGWKGAPILAFEDGDRLQAVTGSHRIYAARAAGIDVPVSKMSFPGASSDDLDSFLSARRDEDVLSSFKKGKFVQKGFITQAQFNIMKAEVRHNG